MCLHELAIKSSYTLYHDSHKNKIFIHQPVSPCMRKASKLNLSRIHTVQKWYPDHRVSMHTVQTRYDNFYKYTSKPPNAFQSQHCLVLRISYREKNDVERNCLPKVPFAWWTQIPYHHWVAYTSFDANSRLCSITRKLIHSSVCNWYRKSSQINCTRKHEGIAIPLFVLGSDWFKMMWFSRAKPPVWIWKAYLLVGLIFDSTSSTLTTDV